MTATAQPQPTPNLLPRTGALVVGRLLLAIAILAVGFGAMHVLAPIAESPLAFSYLARPAALSLPSATGTAPAADWQAEAARAAASLPTRDDADARAASEVAAAFLDAVQASDFAAAWARFDPADREAASAADWTAEQHIWSEIATPAASASAATAPRVQRLAAYPASPSRLLALVDGPSRAAGLTVGSSPLLALELVQRDGQWWVAKTASLWAGGSPLQLRPEDRAGLDWLRYPLRLAPLPADLALMAKVAALQAPAGATLTDLALDERPLVTVENPLYTPAQLAPGVRATWSAAPSATATTEATRNAWTETLRGQGWEVVPSPLRLRLVAATGSGDLTLAPLGAADALVRRQVLHLSESATPAPDPASALAYRRSIAQLGAQADAAIAGLQPMPGSRLVEAPADAASAVASGGGDIAGASFVYYFDRAGRQPTDIRTYYAATLSAAGWQRERGASDVGFRTADGTARLYVTGFDDTPLRALAGFTLNPTRYVLVYLAGKP